MPIKPENKKLYPKNWKEIRAKILERANNKCEFCGVSNYSKGFRTFLGGFVNIENNLKAEQLAEKFNHKIIKIILTIAHLDHNPQNNDFNNLKALCQKCHLNYDQEHHLQTRRQNEND